jgi:hypothetical protein
VSADAHEDQRRTQRIEQLNSMQELIRSHRAKPGRNYSCSPCKQQAVTKAKLCSLDVLPTVRYIINRGLHADGKTIERTTSPRLRAETDPAICLHTPPKSYVCQLAALDHQHALVTCVRAVFVCACACANLTAHVGAFGIPLSSQPSTHSTSTQSEEASLQSADRRVRSIRVEIV